MSIEYVICEYCERFTVLRAGTYPMHLRAHHNDVVVSKKYETPAYLVKREESEAAVWHNHYEDWLSYRERLERLRNLQARTLIVQVQWNNVEFLKGSIILVGRPQLRSLHPITLSGSIISLNTIKKEYFNRLYGNITYTLTFVDGKLSRLQSPDFLKMQKTIGLATAYWDFKNALRLSYKEVEMFLKHPAADILTLNKSKIDRSPYLKHLATLQTANRKIIPMFEPFQQRREECFIFRLSTRRGNQLIIWENVNENRASHLFLATKENEDIVLKKVITYILREDLSQRRSRLQSDTKENQELKRYLEYKSHIIHKGLYDYELYLNYLIKTN